MTHKPAGDDGYDSRGNLTTGTFGYDIHNNLTTGPSSATLAYDPGGRLYETAGGTTTRFLYDGATIVGEYNTSGVLQRRYVPGPGIDEPVVWYEGANLLDPRWLISDERGSIIAVTDDNGVATDINTYDDFGIPGSANEGRFQYTGQAWLPEVSRYHYRARAYAPEAGRFQQTDPILTAGGMNIYAYVANDPMNWVDPWGLRDENCGTYCTNSSPITVTGTRGYGMGGFTMGLGGLVLSNAPDEMVADDPDEGGITVTGYRRPGAGLGYLGADNINPN